MAHLLKGTVVACMIHGVLTVDELLRSSSYIKMHNERQKVSNVLCHCCEMADNLQQATVDSIISGR